MQTATFSCLECRKNHKKCDKILPTCLQCSKRNKQCTYKEPDRRGPKHYRPRPYPSNQISELASKQTDTLWTSHNIALEIMCLFVLILPENSLSEVKEYIQTAEGDDSSSIFTKDVLGLVYVRNGELILIEN